MSLSPLSITNFFKALSIDHGSLGLLVIKNSTVDFSFNFKEKKIFELNVSHDTDYQEILEKITECAEKKMWCQINLLEAYLHPEVYNQLRNIATMGHLQFFSNNPTANLKEMVWPNEAKIVLVANEQDLEKIDIPTFLNLFGPIFREE